MYLYLNRGVRDIDIAIVATPCICNRGVDIAIVSIQNLGSVQYTTPQDPPPLHAHICNFQHLWNRKKCLNIDCAIFPVLEMVKNAYIRQLPSWEGTTTGVAVKPSTADSSSTQSTIAMQFHHSDPHLRKEEEFGVPGRTMKVGKEKFAVCTVIGAAPHTSCPFYRQHQVMISRTIC